MRARHQIDRLVDPNFSNFGDGGSSAGRESQEQGVSITDLLLDLLAPRELAFALLKWLPAQGKINRAAAKT
jgi:hypothetical protein